MIFAELIWAAPLWMLPATVVTLLVTMFAVGWSYRTAALQRSRKRIAFLLKTLALLIVAFCLMEPLIRGTRPRPGDNIVTMFVDNSRSLQIRDAGEAATRGELLREQLAVDSSWQTRLGQEFDVRRYAFDTHVRPVEDFSQLGFSGDATSLAFVVSSLSRQLKGRPQAAMMLFTDGILPDIDEDKVDWESLPPIFPVIVGADNLFNDISLSQLTVSQTNFEAAPVTIVATIRQQGYDEKPIVVQLLDENDNPIEQQELTAAEPDKPLVHRFQFRPDKSGVRFYSVRAFAKSDASNLGKPGEISEITLDNNERTIEVDRSTGPYRVLYVSGRPNWEFKFLRRAIAGDEEVDLVGLVRIAKKEPKFTFRGRTGERTNPIFRGFGNQGDEQAEQYDEPVLLRLGTRDGDELRSGFPKDADELYEYHALIIDDLEAEYFTQDQMSLVQKFVSQRGGGLLMLGGLASFGHGRYQRTPIGEMLPVYLQHQPKSTGREMFQLVLTREGWLQPWVRLRESEEAEEERLSEMPRFQTVSYASRIKPGASVLSQVRSAEGKMYPALVAQRFGSGRAAALMIGDLWRWGMRRKVTENSDLEKSWRQTIRWLVSDVPRRVEVATQRQNHQPGEPITVRVQARDEQYRPLDNAQVRVDVIAPDGSPIELIASPSSDLAGTYETNFAPREHGPYRASVTVTSVDGSPVGTGDTGWTHQPSVEEFRDLLPNRDLLERLAKRTGGEMLAVDRLDKFVADLPNRKLPVVEQHVYPLWHRWPFFLLAVACLIGEWGLRRMNGLP